VKEMKLTLEYRKRQIRTIYELLNKDPRIQYKDVGEVLGVDWRTVSTRMKEAFEQGFIVGPQIRKKSYRNFKQYMYFVRCEDPIGLYEKYIDDRNVIYHAIMDGFANFWIISRKRINIEGVIVILGLNSDFHISYAPNHSWDAGIGMMWKKLKHFDPLEYVPRGIIKTHWDETVEWDEQDEILFREFKYDLRKPLEPLVKEKYHIWSGDAYEWLKRLPECCTIYTCYFPETISAYDPYLFMFETDYEDFVIDLFSQLPTTTYFFKVSDRLFMYARIERGSMRIAHSRIPNVVKLHVPLLVRDLQKRGIVKSKGRAAVECYWKEDPEGS
jgi:hypothetical protein